MDGVFTADERELLASLSRAVTDAAIQKHVAALADVFRERFPDQGDAEMARVVLASAALAQQVSERVSSFRAAERIINVLSRVAADLAGVELDTAP